MKDTKFCPRSFLIYFFSHSCISTFDSSAKCRIRLWSGGKHSTRWGNGVIQKLYFIFSCHAKSQKPTSIHTSISEMTRNVCCALISRTHFDTKAINIRAEITSSLSVGLQLFEHAPLSSRKSYACTPIEEKLYRIQCHPNFLIDQLKMPLNLSFNARWTSTTTRFSSQVVNDYNW